MSSKKSDILLDEKDWNVPKWRGWFNTLIANGPVPLLLLALFIAGKYIDDKNYVDRYYSRMIMLIGVNIILAVSLQLINGFSGQFSLGQAGFMAVGAYMAAYPAKAVSHGLTDPCSSLLFYVSLATVVAAMGIVLLLLFWGIRATGELHRALPGTLVIAVIAWLMLDLALANQYRQAPGWLIWTQSFTSLPKIFNFITEHGQPMANAVAGKLPDAVRAPTCYLVLVIGAGCCAGVVGLIVGMPALRLRGDYLAIATLGLSEIIRIVIQNSRPLGGALGLTGIPKYTNFAWLYGGALVTIVVIWRLAYSAKGRSIMAVREDEIAAAATGVDSTHHKVLAFVVGAFFAGVAGSMYSLYERSITPSYYGMQKSIEIVVMVTLGGLGSISGAILAAIVLTLLPEMLRAISDLRMIIYSLMLVFMMLLRPQGLLGGRELWPRRGVPRRQAVATEDRDDRQEAFA